MKTSELLKLAKTCLWTGKSGCGLNTSQYLCHAIEHANRYQPHKDKLRLLKVYRKIQRCLGGEGTVEIWLRARYPDVTTLQIQKVRHRWLDGLIKLYAAKGD